ncbi:MAG: protein translocase subunit SecD [Bacteroidetes bacterium]|nr:protein translocase subunit SecD [Bacteroidota bacterium]MCH8523789.1 protein translocase subunit SecD [Balneolales bacterium]
MNNKNGTKIAFIAAFVLLCAYYLSFSVRYWLEMRHIDSLDDQTRVTYVADNNARIQDLRERILTLGLDLQGGMHVTLELATPQLMRELAREFADDEFEAVLRTATQISNENNTDVIDEFLREFERTDPEARLSRYFRSDADNITRRSSNAEVVQFLKNQRNAAVDRAIQIVRNRIDRFGVTEPSIVRQGANRIVVELPGVDDEERVRNLLRGTARLEFRLTAEPQELLTSLERIIDFYTVNVETEEGVESQENQLLDVFIPQGRGIVFGSAASTDTAMVNMLLDREEITRLLPRDVELMWTHRAEFVAEDRTEFFSLIGVRRNVELTGEVITEARPAFDPMTNEPQVSMTMNSEGARTWARITGANIGRPVAIVLDGLVYTYPNVITRINDGRSSITGLGGVREAEDLVNILLSGALPAPLDIVEERTVGPTLGQASIDASLRAIIIGLLIVGVFMVLYYRAGGFVADIALVTSIFFILGILAAFGATLTLPGMAGIVLTIGMAVDANVLIFDRIREEQRAGKSLLASIDGGYSNAMSAIMDANVTTFLVAIILYSFGVGPIKGFAVTLMAGIVSSLFSALIITRVIIDYMTRDKSRKVNFG